MKNNQLTLILVGLLFFSTLATGFLILKFNSSLKQLQDFEIKIVSVRQTSAVLQSLLNDSIEYSKRNPAIDPLLQSITNQPAKVPGK